MSYKTTSSVACLFFLVFCCAASTLAQGPKGDASSSAAARLRAMYFARDYEGGYAEGKKLARQYPNAVVVQVWFIMNAGRNDKPEEALELAETLKASYPQDGWSWFAMAGALNFHNEREKEALPASEKMLALLPDNDDAIWLRASVLRAQGKPEDAIAFIEQSLPKVKDPAELLVLKASALYSQYRSPQQIHDEAKLKSSMEAFAEALKADPNNVDALYLQSSYLNNEKKSSDAFALLKKAVALTPDSNAIHQEYWRSIRGRTDLNGEAKQKEIETDIAALLKSRGDFTGALLAVSTEYDSLKLADKKKQIDDRILALAPISREAEWVLIGRCRQLGDEIYREKDKKDPAKLMAYRKRLQEYISRPQHFNKGLLGEVYRNLFYQIKDDPAVGNAELLGVAKGMLEYEKMNVHLTYPAAAVALAERKTNFAEAEAWAREGIEQAKKKLESQRPFYKDEADYEEALNWMTGMNHDALGWVLFKEGRLEDAEKELLEAHKRHEDINNLYHLGQFYEARKDYANAEEYYRKGSLVAGQGENKNKEALKAIYKLRNGSLAGYESYLAKLDELDATNRKTKVLSERLNGPQPLKPFTLKTLDGKAVSSADLKGKVLVVNIWGKWCNPCVREMPEFQKLHEKYQNDARVAILSINNDQDPSDVQKWMKENKYNFNVLLDDGFLDKIGINAFPTTWFVDREGRIAFVKLGWTERLAEEFSWRIEALKANEPSAMK